MLLEILKGKYNFDTQCDNCKSKVTLRIPRGIRIEDFISSNKAKCSYCGCIIIPAIDYQKAKMEVKNVR